jgi:hypothetical protein
MTRSLRLPDAPVAAEDGRMSAPSAQRNRAAITDLVRQHAPASGRALEIASGTGEHVVALAAAMPGLVWHPTDIDAGRRRSIDAWVAAERLSNVTPARHLDAARHGWATGEPRADLIVLVNLLHLIPDVAAGTILDEIAKALSPQGIAVIYGPFLRDGEATSEGDRAFDASLRAQDPDIGYKDAGWVLGRMRGGGLTPLEERQMPANNLAFVFRKG